MDIKIVKADLSYLKACSVILADSPLGTVYFGAGTPDYFGNRVLETAFNNDEVYVALTPDNDCAAFGWIEPEGFFHLRPYFHILTVATAYRGQGIGTQFMLFFEDLFANTSDKLFLIVADFNTRARLLYERLGYRELGKVPDLYKPGVTEYIMGKYKNQEKLPAYP